MAGGTSPPPSAFKPHCRLRCRISSTHQVRLSPSSEPAYAGVNDRSLRKCLLCTRKEAPHGRDTHSRHQARPRRSILHRQALPRRSHRHARRPSHPGTGRTTPEDRCSRSTSSWGAKRSGAQASPTARTATWRSRRTCAVWKQSASMCGCSSTTSAIWNRTKCMTLRWRLSSRSGSPLVSARPPSIAALRSRARFCIARRARTATRTVARGWRRCHR